MDDRTRAILVTIAFSIVGVVGDYFLKLASKEENFVQSRWFYVGFAFYASTAFGWVFVMKSLDLSQIGVIYSVSMILLLTAIGVFGFGEVIGWREVIGILMAIGSLILLMRFA